MYDVRPEYGDSWCSTVYTWDGRLASPVRAVAAQRRELATIFKRYSHPHMLEWVGGEEARDALERAACAVERESMLALQEMVE